MRVFEPDRTLFFFQSNEKGKKAVWPRKTGAWCQCSIVIGAARCVCHASTVVSAVIERRGHYLIIVIKNMPCSIFSDEPIVQLQGV